MQTDELSDFVDLCRNCTVRLSTAYELAAGVYAYVVTFFCQSEPAPLSYFRPQRLDLPALMLHFIIVAIGSNKQANEVLTGE